MSADAQAEKIMHALVERLNGVEEQMKNGVNALAATGANMAKQDPGGFTDQTGNLRNSIGWIPADESKTYTVKKTTKEGSAESTGSVSVPVKGKIQAVVFTGMNYGRHVEFKPGHYVLARAINNLIQNGTEIVKGFFK